MQKAASCTQSKEMLIFKMVMAEKQSMLIRNALKFDPDNEAILKNLQIAKKKQKQKDNKQNQQNNSKINKITKIKTKRIIKIGKETKIKKIKNKRVTQKSGPNGNIGDKIKEKGIGEAEKQNQKNDTAKS